MKRRRSLSRQARTVLALLLQSGQHWSHGYEIARVSGVKSGTLYPLLIRLAEQGYLETEWRQSPETGKPPRHVYRLTASGARLARDNLPDQARAGAGFGVGAAT